MTKNVTELTKTEMVLRERIIITASKKDYLPHYLFQAYADLDGTHAKKCLEALGFIVIESKDTGRYGYALTNDGIMLHTNGYCHKV